jgi:hypothetical protein
MNGNSASPDYQLPPDVAAMIEAGNAARTRGADPSAIREELADDKSYATKRFVVPAAEPAVMDEIVNDAAHRARKIVDEAYQDSVEEPTPRAVIGSKAHQRSTTDSAIPTEKVTGEYDGHIGASARLLRKRDGIWGSRHN